MKISTKGTYALGIMTDIAKNYKDEAVSLSLIASRNNMSVKYLEQIVNMLTKNNLLTSFRGTNGGYKLSRDAREITLGQILNATEGELKTVSCINSGVKCDKVAKCLTVGVWAKLDNIVNDFLNTTTLDDIVNKRI